MNSRMNLITILVILLPIKTTSQSKDWHFMELIKLSDQLLVLKVAESFNSQIAALASKRGVVVIDTSTMFGLASAVRERNETEFGRNDFL